MSSDEPGHVWHTSPHQGSSLGSRAQIPTWKCLNCWCEMTGFPTRRNAWSASLRLSRHIGYITEGKERRKELRWTERKEGRKQSARRWVRLQTVLHLPGKSQRSSWVVCRCCLAYYKSSSCQSYPANAQSISHVMIWELPPETWFLSDIQICR